MSADDRRCPDSGCEHNDGGRCTNQQLAAMGMAASSSAMQGGMPFMAPFGPTLMVLPAMLNEDGLGVPNSCPQRKERSLRD